MPSFRHMPWPPLINDSSIHPALVMAFTLHGALTIDELMQITGITERTHLQKRLGELRARKIFTQYRWGGNEFLKGGKKPTNWLVSNRMWALDPRHPLYRPMRTLARALAKGFPLPGERPLKWDRHYTGPREPIYDLDPPDLQILGQTEASRMIMFLSHASNIPTEKHTTLRAAAVVPTRLLDFCSDGASCALRSAALEHCYRWIQISAPPMRYAIWL